MKNNDKFSPYATNKAGRIESPRTPGKDDPRATKTVGDDLRTKGRKG